MKLIAINSKGKASGTVWHSSPDCNNLHMRDSGTREVSDEIIEVLGFSKCRACERHDLLTDDPILLRLVEALYRANIFRQKEEKFSSDAMTVADQFRKALRYYGIELHLTEPEVIDPTDEDQPEAYDP